MTANSKTSNSECHWSSTEISLSIFWPRWLSASDSISGVIKPPTDQESSSLKGLLKGREDAFWIYRKAIDHRRTWFMGDQKKVARLVSFVRGQHLEESFVKIAQWRISNEGCPRNSWQECPVKIANWTRRFASPPSSLFQRKSFRSDRSRFSKSAFSNRYFLALWFSLIPFDLLSWAQPKPPFYQSKIARIWPDWSHWTSRPNLTILQWSSFAKKHCSLKNFFTKKFLKKNLQLL